MTLNEYLDGKTIESVQYLNGLIFNVMTNEGYVGLDIDTSNVESGQVLITSTEFTYVDGILEVNGIEIDSNNVDIL